jgi:hypothetical protein
VHKIQLITPNIGVAYSGMGPDSRVLVRKSRKQAQQYKRLYNVWSFLLSSLDVQDLGFLFSCLDDFCEEVNAVFIQENLEKFI